MALIASPKPSGLQIDKIGILRGKLDIKDKFIPLTYREAEMLIATLEQEHEHALQFSMMTHSTDEYDEHVPHEDY